jgi:hypothetical protein
MSLIINLAVGGFQYKDDGTVLPGYFGGFADEYLKLLKGDDVPAYNWYQQNSKWLHSWTDDGNIANKVEDTKISDNAALQVKSAKVWGLPGVTKFTDYDNQHQTL